jgi:uncharacterized membrane protein YgcG
MRKALLLLVAVLALAACGEPEVDLTVPTRGADQHVLDEVGVLDAALEERLAAVSRESGYDVVALAFEDERASLGQADRGGRALLRGWDADVVLVVVGMPGDLTSEAEQRARYFGVFATDRFAVTRGLRERIIDDAVAGPAADNRWAEAYHAAVDELEAAFAAEGA